MRRSGRMRSSGGIPLLREAATKAPELCERRVIPGTRRVIDVVKSGALWNWHIFQSPPNTLILVVVMRAPVGRPLLRHFCDHGKLSPDDGPVLVAGNVLVTQLNPVVAWSSLNPVVAWSSLDASKRR